MKEKTFEELINQYSYRGNYISSEKVVGEEAILELMQQVREATITECIDKISELHGSFYKGAYKEYLATNLPPNSIKTDL